MKEHLCVGREEGVVLGDYGDIWEDVRTLIGKTEGKIWVSTHIPITDGCSSTVALCRCR